MKRIQGGILPHCKKNRDRYKFKQENHLVKLQIQQEEGQKKKHRPHFKRAKKTIPEDKVKNVKKKLNKWEHNKR